MLMIYEMNSYDESSDLCHKKKDKKKDPAASYLRRGKPNYCRRESA
ncbi:hypothetical protein [uncultured Holdemanella sp.]|nr:hypothetical protein [uncultured Holdemanella sp.]